MATSATPSAIPIRSFNHPEMRAPASAQTPMTNTGKVVNRLACVLVAPEAVWIMSSNGPMAARAGRRFSATATMAMMANKGRNLTRGMNISTSSYLISKYIDDTMRPATGYHCCHRK